MLQIGRSLVRSQLVSVDFSSTQPLTEMSTRSISWGYRRPVRKADNLPPSCAVVMKSWTLNFLEPSGPLQACNGIAVPLPFLWVQLLSDNFGVAFDRIFKRIIDEFW